MTGSPEEVQRLVGVYDADGTLRGEAAYVLGHLIGRRQCSLCDITHSWKGRRSDFDAMAERLGLPFELLHRDEVSPELAASVDGWPSVLAVTATGPRVLLDDDDLRACHGEPDALEPAIRAALTERRLRVPD